MGSLSSGLKQRLVALINTVTSRVRFLFLCQGDLSIQESFRIAATGHFLDPPQSQTTELNNLMKDLPKWVTTVAWSASYNEWIF